MKKSDSNGKNDKNKNDSSKASNNANDTDSKTNDGDNTKSALGVFSKVLPKYFSSEWSFAQFRVPDVRTIVAFGSEENSIVGM